MDEEPTLFDAHGNLIKFETVNYPGPLEDFWYTEIDALGEPVSKISKALAIPACYAAVAAYAKDIASMPCHLMRQLKKKKEKATDHPLYDLLYRKPNTWMSSFTFWQYQQWIQLLYGNYYAFKARDRLGFVKELIPLDPKRIDVRQDAVTLKLEYLYLGDSGQNTIFTQDEIFHTREIGSDSIKGKSRIEQAFDTFSLGSDIGAHNRAFIKNDSRPQGVLVSSQNINPEQREQLRASWESAHRGPKKTGRVAILPFGVDFKPISITPHDMQLLEILQVTRLDEVAMIFDVPPYRLQDFRRATFGNVEQADLFWAKNSLRPRIVALEKDIEFQLLGNEVTRANLFVKFNMSAIFRADIKTRYESHHIALEDGWLTRNEVRDIEDFDPADDERLDQFTLPVNRMTLDQIDSREARAEEEGKSDSFTKAKPALMASLKRLVTKEQKAILRALKKENWIKIAEDFYIKHLELMKAEFETLGQSLGLQSEIINNFLNWFVEQRRDQLLALTTNPNNEERKNKVEKWTEHLALNSLVYIITDGQNDK